MRMGDSRILKDYPCGYNTRWRKTIIFTRAHSARSLANVVLNFPSCRHRCATILQPWRCKNSGRRRWYQQDHSVEEVRVFWNLAHAETLPPRHAGSSERQYNGLESGFVPTKKNGGSHSLIRRNSERTQSKARTCGPTVSRSNFQKLINIDQRLQSSREHDGSITPRWRLPVTESFALPPDPRWNAMTDYPAAIPLLAIQRPVPEMPNAHDACAHLAGALMEPTCSSEFRSRWSILLTFRNRAQKNGPGRVTR